VIPPAQLDQLRAATADADHRLRSATTHSDWRSTETPGPVVARIAATFAAAVTPDRACSHVGSPRPVVGVAHRPGRVMCGPCARVLLSDTIGTPEDNTCDGCRHQVGALTTGVVLVGPIAVTFGLCRTCDRRNSTPPNRRSPTDRPPPPT
jgi:hypothetical protein